jgi:hypothetical protein
MSDHGQMRLTEKNLPFSAAAEKPTVHSPPEPGIQSETPPKTLALFANPMRWRHREAA